MVFHGTDIFVPSGADLESYFAQMTSGTSVRLLLERGGVWTGDYVYRQAGGGVGGEHNIIAAQGSGALPLISGSLQIGVEATPITNVKLKDLQFTGEGPTIAGSGSGCTLRGLVVQGASQGIIIQADTGLRWEDVAVNSCRVMDLSNTTGEHVQGVYCARVDGLNIVDSVFDNAVAPKDIFSHHAYIQNGCTSVTVRRNIFSRASSHGLQLRPGGEASYNLFIDDPIALLAGGGTDPEASGVTINIHDNLVMGGGDINGVLPRGWAYYLENIAGGKLHNNLGLDGVGGDKRGLTKDCSATGVEGDPEVGVLGVQGVNYYKNHPTVHTDAGASTGTTVVWHQVPIPTAKTSFTDFGLAWDKIRAGKIKPTLIIAAAKKAVGLSV